MSCLEIRIKPKKADHYPVETDGYADGQEHSRSRYTSELHYSNDLDKQLTELVLTPKAYGQLLGKALFVDGLLKAFYQSETPVKIALTVEPLELKGLHWEYLCGPIRADSEFDLLSLDQRYLLTHQVSTDQSAYPTLTKAQVKVLTVIANPPKDNGYHIAHFDEPTAYDQIKFGMGQTPMTLLGQLPNAHGQPTLSECFQSLSQDHYPILHIMAHGQWTKRGFCLYLLDDQGQVKPCLDTEFIEQLAKLSHKPSLIFLSCCHSGERKEHQIPFAYQLIQQLGTSFVIGMSGRVGIDYANQITPHFYQQLLNTGQPEQALAKASLGQADNPDEWVPIIYTRQLWGRLFETHANRETQPSRNTPNKGSGSDLLQECCVFLSSPNDMQAEREAVRAYFKAFNISTAKKNYRVIFEVLDWEHYVDARQGRPQALVNKVLEDHASRLVLFIGILGQRFGTPPGETQEGQSFESGTQEEYEWVRQYKEQHDRPEIKWFFLDSEFKPTTKDRKETKKQYDQWEQVQDFKDKLQEEKPRHWVIDFTDLNDFEKKLNKDLNLWLNHPDRSWVGLTKRPEYSDITPARGLDAISLSKPELQPYLNRLKKSTQHSVFNPSDDPDERLNLQSVYIELKVAKQSLDKNLRLTQEEPLSDAGLSEPILKLLSEQHAIVLLGGPGSGKSTWVNYVSHLLAIDELPKYARALSGKIPIRLVLRDVINTSTFKQLAPDTKGNSLTLWSSIHDNLNSELSSSVSQAIFDCFEKATQQQQAVYFFDGLDEVSDDKRNQLKTAIEDFITTHTGSGNRFVITVRPYAYAERQWQLSTIPSYSLLGLSNEQIEQFINQWYCHTGQQRGWQQEFYHHKSQRLVDALTQNNRIQEQARIPLLLTLIVNKHVSDGELPKHRAQLYQASIDLLLNKWRKKRLEGGLISKGLDEDILETTMPKIETALGKLAYELHKGQVEVNESSQTAADINETQLEQAFKPITRKAIFFDDLMSFLQEQSGLLIARDNHTYAFPHRSFQEYLAAKHLVDKDDVDDSDSETLISLTQAQPRGWREVFLLALGIVRKPLRVALSYIEDLLDGDYDSSRRYNNQAMYKVIIAVQALRELSDEGEENSHFRRLNDQAKRWLEGLLTDLPIRDRVEAGDALAELGDPRTGVGIVVKDDQRVPDIDWLEIPAGSFMMGSEDEQAYDDEKPVHPVTFQQGFKLSRYQ